LASPPTPHLEALLQRDIDVIRKKLLAMVALDERALTRAFQAFLTRDRQLAYSVILRDQDVDALETELDRLCVEFIIRHQPAAANLRFVYSASKVAGQLERVGDYAESIARQIVLMSHLPYEIPKDRFHEIANLAIPMLHNAVQAFVDKNPDLARTTMASEPRVNQVRDDLSDELMQWREEGRLPLEALPPLMTVARRFERVSDQATNICEEALYFATGEYLRHLPREGFRVLFVDDANGCLSRIAEVAANALSAKRFCFSSAGLTAGAADPRTVWFLSEKGFDISHQPPRSLAQALQKENYQIMVALSKDAEKAFPQRPTKVLGLQWAVADPSKAQGTPEEIRAEYERAYESLSHHVRDLVHAIIGDGQASTDQEVRCRS
jgi:phosphate transport system protein